MSISDFIKKLQQDKRFHGHIAGYTYIAPREARYRSLEISSPLQKTLQSQGIEYFFSHQVETIDMIRNKKNVVVMTPTASGKSLIYNIPVLEAILEDPKQRALYIFPLKGLEQDQIKTLNELYRGLIQHISSPLPISEHINRIKKSTDSIVKCAEVYDGDTTAYRRKKIREAIPNVIFTNPDMIHLAFNPFHKKWEQFFKNLRFIIIDEIHTYRGVFGSHVAHVFRRLRRICRYWGAQPQFIAASATIANPSELAENLLGVPFTIVSQSGAPHAGKHFLFINPTESAYTETTRLFVHCLRAGLKTIVFTKARKITELIYTWTIHHAPEFTDKISPYRAGFLPKERREIEQRLFSGELLGVISTSALELGVDIGGLDCCILCGYPGSISSTWQRAGRVGRHGRKSIIALVAIQDALDQYFMRHPEYFFKKSHEAAVIDPDNRNILKKHITCATSEVYLKSDDNVYNMEKLSPVLSELVQENEIAPGRRGDIWFSKKRMPQREIGIRATGSAFFIVNKSGGKIGELDGSRVFREAFPGAIYLHKGKQYKVINVDWNEKKISCQEADVLYYTQSLSKEDTTITEEHDTRPLGRFTLHWGTLLMHQVITGYEKKRIFDRIKISRHALDMPEYVFETEGLWIVIDAEHQSFLEKNGYDLAGTLHAIEHCAISCMPLFALCDRGDIGGLSYSYYPHLKHPAIFIYDGIEGGIGLTKRASEVIMELFGTTLKIIEECSCKDGCPSCIQDPQCGSGNIPLDKKGAKELLKRWGT